MFNEKNFHITKNDIKELFKIVDENKDSYHNYTFYKKKKNTLIALHKFLIYFFIIRCSEFK